MAENKIVLFDLPSKGRCHCWSPNAWKGRLVLNFKGVPYETRWVEYPDIEPLFVSFGIPPNAPGTAATRYSIPAVQLPDGRYVMGSMQIAQALEELQPSPSLFLESPLVARTQEAVSMTDKALAPIARFRVLDSVINPASVEYFERTRAERFGMPLRDLARSDLAGEAAWTAAAAGIARLRVLVAENEAGPYVMGADPGHADFVLAAYWRFLQILDRDGDLFGRLMSYDENFVKHFAACQKWLERDDY